MHNRSIRLINRIAELWTGFEPLFLFVILLHRLWKITYGIQNLVELIEQLDRAPRKRVSDLQTQWPPLGIPVDTMRLGSNRRISRARAFRSDQAQNLCRPEHIDVDRRGIHPIIACLCWSRFSHRFALRLNKQAPDMPSSNISAALSHTKFKFKIQLSALACINSC